MSGWASAPPVLLVSKAKAAAKSLAGRGSRESLASLGSSSVVLGKAPGAALGSGRSRSPPRAALPGLRVDAPGRLERAFVGLPRVLDEVARAQALGALDRDILAVTTQRTNAARLRTIEAALGLWGIALWPPTPVAFKALAATLKWDAMPRLPFTCLPTGLQRRGRATSWTSSR